MSQPHFPAISAEGLKGSSMRLTEKLLSRVYFSHLVYLMRFGLFLWSFLVLWYLRVSSQTGIALIQSKKEKKTNFINWQSHFWIIALVNWSLSPCSNPLSALQYCGCGSSTFEASFDTWVRRVEPGSAELTPGLRTTAPSCSTWASPSGLYAPKLRFSPPKHRLPCGAPPRSSAPRYSRPVRTAEDRILSDKHLQRAVAPFGTPSRLRLKLTASCSAPALRQSALILCQGNFVRGTTSSHEVL